MRERVLLYNFSDDRIAKIRKAALPLKIGVKALTLNEQSQKIGFLAGIKEVTPAEESDGEVFTDELMLICGLTSAKLDAFIRSLYKNGLGKIALKAILTPANIEWTGKELYDAVKADHEAMSGANN